MDEFLGFLLFRPLFAFFQGLFAILTPVRLPELIRIQRIATVFLAFAALATATFFVNLLFVRRWDVAAVCFLIWFVSTTIAGILGGHIERG